MKKCWKIFAAFWFLTLLPVLAQDQSKLNEYLKQNDLRDLIGQFSEEKIILKDPGERQLKIEARSYQIVPGLRVQVFASFHLCTVVSHYPCFLACPTSYDCSPNVLCARFNGSNPKNGKCIRQSLLSPITYEAILRNPL